MSEVARLVTVGGRLDLAWGDAFELRSLSAYCRLKDGSEHRSRRLAGTAEAGHYAAACGPLCVDALIRLEGDQVFVEISVSALEPVQVLEVGVTGRPLVNGSEPEWMLYSGHQSWDPAGHARLGGLTATGKPVTRESWWTVGLAGATGGGLAAAGLSAAASALRCVHREGELRLLWCEPEGFDPAPVLWEGSAGTTWHSEQLALTADRDVTSALSALLGRVEPAAGPPRGWLSWYHFGPWVAREDVLANAAILGAGDGELGYRLIQVDDGWQEAYGDWIPNRKFPGGLAALARDLADRDQVLGAWTAPFLVSAGADLARTAPEAWFVQDPTTGVRGIDPRHAVFGPMHVLDARHPDVLRHLRAMYRRLYEDGVRYFKIDFLYAGGYAGSRALRQGIQAIREGVRDAYILACGAPLLPMVGLVEGCRVGQDVASPIYDFETGAPRPTIFGDEVTWVARNAGARQCLHHWFHLDPDVALVGGNLTLEQGRQLVTLSALTGGPFFAGDDLRALDGERLALLTNPEVLQLAGGSPAIPDWEPGVADLPASHWRRGDVLAVFNWTAEAREIPLRAPGLEGCRDLWARRDLKGLADGALLPVAAHSVRLLRIASG